MSELVTLDEMIMMLDFFIVIGTVKYTFYYNLGSFLIHPCLLTMKIHYISGSKITNI